MSAKLTLKMDLRGLNALPAEVRKQGGQVVHDTAESIRAAAVEAIHAGPKTGRIYKVSRTHSKTGKAYKRGARIRLHQASAPGEAPATDQGNLANSIQTDHVNEAVSYVVVGAEYGAPLEFGTDDGKIAPRPFLQPAVEAEAPAFEAALTAMLKRFTR